MSFLLSSVGQGGHRTQFKESIIPSTSQWEEGQKTCADLQSTTITKPLCVIRCRMVSRAEFSTWAPKYGFFN